MLYNKKRKGKVVAVDRELYERYKKMKAEGRNITLAELKEQLEKERHSEAYTPRISDSPASLAETNRSVQLELTQSNSVQPAVQKPLAQPFIQKQAETDYIQTNELKKIALIGYPLGHSLSEYIHDAGFRSIGINARYDILETRPDQLVERIKYLKTNGYSGFNVTIPLKLPVTMFLDELDSSADIVHAVNTIKIDSETKFLKGYNTDAVGFKNALPKDINLCGKTAGILGTGGAARAAITALAQYQVKEFKIYTRNIANSIEFLNYLRKTFPSIEFNAYQIDRIRDLSEVNILVNATPIGMSGNAVGFTPVEEPQLITLPPDALVYDVIYNPKKTVLIKLAQKHNYKTVNGLDMLIYQAMEAEKIWTGHLPDFKDMKIAALEEL